MIRVIRHHAPAGAFPLLASEILLISSAFYGGAMLLFQPDPSFYFLYEGGTERGLLMMLSLLAGLYFFDLYSDIGVQSRVLLLQQLCRAVGVALLAQSLIAYIAPDYMLPQLLMLCGSVFTLLVLFVWRMLYSAVLLRAIGREKIVFLGCDPTIQEIVAEISSDPGSAFEVAAWLDDGGAVTAGAGAPSIVGPIASLRQVVAQRKPARIVVGRSDWPGPIPVRELLELRFAGYVIEEASLTYELVYRRICSRDLPAGRVAFLPEFTPPGSSLRLTRAISRLLAALLMTLLAPVLAAVAVALRIRSREPVLVRLPRIGKDGRVFQLLRFREARAAASWYRRLSLAALPELLNVVRGEMSMVGPRPASPERARRLSFEFPLYDYRHNVRPGVTGWAQINISSSEPDQPVRELEYDLYYIKHMSQALNAYILLNTFKHRVLRMKSPAS